MKHKLTTLFTAIALICCSCFNTVVANELTLPEKLSLPAQTIEPQSFNAGSTTDQLVISASYPWFGVVGGRVTIPASEVQSVKLWLEPNFSTTERRGVISVTKTSDGTTTTIPVIQPPYFTSVTNGFPARLETKNSSNDGWESNGIATPANSSAVLSAVSASGKRLAFTEDGGLEISDTQVGDYFIYAVPVENLAAGEQIDIMCTMVAMESSSPKYWVVEYWDNDRWNTIDGDLRVAEEDKNIEYSFYNKYFKSAHHTSYAQSFTLANPIVNNTVKVRLRILSEGGGATKLSGGQYTSLSLVRHNNSPAIIDTKRVLFIGNSFTYFFGTPFMFKEIARSQGHQVDAVISVKGGQEFSEHLRLERSNEAITRGGYDIAFLQDTSPNPAIYADTGNPDILNASREINKLTFKHSPNCQIVYERTWACPHNNYRTYGSYDKLDYLLKKGTEMLKKELKQDKIIVSPVGLGFRVGREHNLPLLHTDNRHQSRVGAYMKACINYLFIYQTRFTDSVSDCGVDAKTAALVRQIAEQVVFDGVKEKYNY